MISTLVMKQEFLVKKVPDLSRWVGINNYESERVKTVTYIV